MGARRRAKAVLFVALAMAGAVVAVASPAGAFGDVPADSYYRTAADWLRGEGITSGYGGDPDRFAPEITVTRAQMATFLWRLEGQDTAPPSGFTDVPAGAYYATAAAWLKDRGLSTGYGGDATRFAPDVTVNRAQMAAFLWRLAGSPGAPASGFTDVPAGAYYAEAAAWLKAQGITGGYGGDATRFAPDVVVTRAQMAAFLWRASGSPAPRLSYGATVTGAISSPGEQDVFRFPADAGDRLSLDRIDGSSLLRTRLVAPDGAVIWADPTQFADRFVDLTQTGFYRLTISYGTEPYTGTYRFAINNVRSPRTFTTPFGTTVGNGVPAVGMGNIELPGASDRYTIAATAGDRLSLDRIGGSTLLRTKLVAPNGAVIWADTTQFADRFVDLTQTGNHQLVISYGTEAYTGTYGFAVSLT
jgi:hypothetical protein